jgi:hypothetical protein
VSLGQVERLHEGQRGERVEHARLAHPVSQRCELAWHAGTHVRHAVWGHGEILATDFMGLRYDEVVGPVLVVEGGGWHEEDAPQPVLAVTRCSEKQHAVFSRPQTEAALYSGGGGGRE